MLLISFWQVLMFLIAFLSLKQAKNEEKIGIVHGKARLKLNYTKNPSFGKTSKPLPNQSSMQGRESEKKSNIQQFGMAMRNAKRSTSCRTESKIEKNEFLTLCEISHTLQS